MHVGVGTQVAKVVVVGVVWVKVLHVSVPTQASAVPHWASRTVSWNLIGIASREGDVLATARLMRSAAKVLVNCIMVVLHSG